MHPVKSVIDVRKVLRERVGHFIQLLVANAARRITQTDSGLFRQRDFERYDVSRSVAVAVTIKASSRILRWPCLVLESATQLFVHPKALRRRMNCPETGIHRARGLQLVTLENCGGLVFDASLFVIAAKGVNGNQEKCNGQRAPSDGRQSTRERTS